MSNPNKRSERCNLKDMATDCCDTHRFHGQAVNDVQENLLLVVNEAIETHSIPVVMTALTDFCANVIHQLKHDKFTEENAVVDMFTRNVKNALRMIRQNKAD